MCTAHWHLGCLGLPGRSRATTPVLVSMMRPKVEGRGGGVYLKTNVTLLTPQHNHHGSIRLHTDPSASHQIMGWLLKYNNGFHTHTCIFEKGLQPFYMSIICK